MTLVVAAALALVGGQAAAQPGYGDGKEVFPEVIALPIGFQPEGISIGRGTTFYVGSLGRGGGCRRCRRS